MWRRRRPSWCVLRAETADNELLGNDIILTMDFSQLLDGAEVLLQQGSAEIRGLDYDSRRVRRGFAFVAMRGETTDGNRYIDQAIANGAAAIVSDSAEVPPRPDLAWARVAHGRRALARLSANFYKHPAERLRITGITGTNGKTTTAYILEAVLRAACRKSALVGTVEYRLPGKVIPAPHTTPEPLDLMQFLSQALGAGATEAVMEVSSHALEQQRIFGVPFDVAVFSNLTRDHLDYHGTLENYFAAKRILFEGCGTEPPRCAILNVDDEYGQKLLAFCRRHSSVVYGYGLDSGDFHARNLCMTPAGNRFQLVTPAGEMEIVSPLIGRVNVYNALAACAAAFAGGCTAEQITKGILSAARVPGRFERVHEGQPFAVVVDYAHTDDALRNLMQVAREFVNRIPEGAAGAASGGVGKTIGRVITVFGCGGDRDRTKRPLMGKAVGEGSDFVVLTSDNPRSEDPEAIMADALPGLRQTGTRYTAQPDRREAIRMALAEARAGDIMLIAGKGHEKTQTTREGVSPFDDFEVAREELHRLGFTGANLPKDKDHGGNK
jgi:UDP-N-acetylmuramoyl-L-alanyl-D-glutamate--2,6-diaminopimelate ligase